MRAWLLLLGVGSSAYLLLRLGATATDGLQRWLAYCGGMLAGLSIIAVSWQGLPALLA